MSSAHELSLEYGGYPLGERELEQLAVFILKPRGRAARHLHHLAIGLHALLSHEGARVEIDSWSWDRSSKVHLQMETGSQRLESAPTAPQEAHEEVTRVRIRKRPPRRNLLTKLFPKDLLRPEKECLAAACRFAGIPILLDGLPLNRPLGGEPVLDPKGLVQVFVTPQDGQHRYLVGHRFAPENIAGPDLETHVTRLQQWVLARRIGGRFKQLRKVNHAGQIRPSITSHAANLQLLQKLDVPGMRINGQPACSCLAVFTNAPDQTESSLTMVADGVVVDEEPELDFPAPFSVVAVVNDLKTDLSLFRRVRDEPFGAFLNCLREHVCYELRG